MNLCGFDSYLFSPVKATLQLQLRNPHLHVLLSVCRSVVDLWRSLLCHGAVTVTRRVCFTSFRPWVLGAASSPPLSSLVTFASIVEEEKQQEAALIRSREKPLALIQVTRAGALMRTHSFPTQHSVGENAAFHLSPSV